MRWFLAEWVVVLLLSNRRQSAAEHVRSLQKRIVGGKKAVSGKYLSYAVTAGPKLCGATLIWKDILLSAAHCKGAFLDGVIIGGIQLNGRDTKEFMMVESEHHHPEYTPGPEFNDIQLVKLAGASNVPIAKLDKSSNGPNDGEVLTVIGFGNDAYGGNIAHTLQEVNTTKVSTEKCAEKYGSMGMTIQPDRMFCAGGVKDKGSCQGDSGGPIWDKDHKLVGIVSWGYECGRAGFPDVNVKVAHYYKHFIMKGICELSDFPPDSCSDESLSTKQPTTALSSAPTQSPTDKNPIVTEPSEAKDKESLTSQVRGSIHSLLGGSSKTDKSKKTGSSWSTPGFSLFGTSNESCPPSAICKILYFEGVQYHRMTKTKCVERCDVSGFAAQKLGWKCGRCPTGA